MKTSLVSVIIPIYNGEKYLSQAVDSVIEQTHENFEIIIVDDCSIDYSNSIASKYVHNFPEKVFLLRNTKNIGVAKSRNIALEHATGDYIAFLDSDDYFESNKLKEQIDFLEKNHLALVHTGVNTISDKETIDWIHNNTSFKYPDYWDKFWNNRPIKSYFDMLSFGCSICWSSVLLRREILGKIRFEEDLIYQNEDWIFLLELSAIAKFGFIAERLTNYRIHKSSYSVLNLISGYNWDSHTAINQTHDRCHSFLRNNYFSDFSYDKFKNKSLRGRIKNRIVFGKKIFNNNASRVKDVYRFFHKERSDKDIDVLILFITDACNLSCSHCFYRNSINQGRSFNYSNFLKLMDSDIKINNLLITGGEPFLDSSVESYLLRGLYDSDVWINTNGFLDMKIFQILDRVLSHRTNNVLTVSVSIDGFENTHNTMRGNNKSYMMALGTLRRLLFLRQKYGNLKVMITTVITPYNITELLDFAKEISIGFDIDYHNFEIQRPKSIWLKDLSKNLLCGVYHHLLDIINKHYRDYYLMNKRRFKLQLNNLLFDERWGFQCVAGRKVFTIYPDGDFASCEMRKTLFNLDEFDYNLGNALRSKKLEDELIDIKNTNCDCTHGCWLITSMQRK